MISSLSAVKYGESVIPESWVIVGGDQSLSLPISFTLYLVNTGDRKILIDAGCDTMPGFDMKYYESPADVLRENGIDPLEITDVFVTHAHHDHIEAVHHFKNATVHIQALEYESSQRKHKYIPEDMKLNVFEDETEVGGVTLLRISGHSTGSCIAEFCANGKNYVISGDECYARRCLTERIPTGSSKNPENSRKFVEKYSDEKYTVLLCHDADILPGQNGVLKIF